MMKKQTLTITALLALLLFPALNASAQRFEDYFEDATLRIDYIFAGNQQKQHIYLQELKKQDRWAGRKSRLAEKFLNGNGQLTVRDHATRQIIYVWTFSTLFQEWLQYDEAKMVDKAFPTSYNIPFPKNPIDITVTLTDKHQTVTTEMTHTVDPKDILIRRIGDNGIPFHYVWKGKATASTANHELRSGKDRNFSASAYDPFESVDITNCIDLAIVAEGYTEAQMGKFYHDCERAVDALFAWEPFRSLKNRFNVVAVAAPSRETGPTVPHLGVWHTTPAGSHYDTFYTERYLMSQDMHHIYALLSGVPVEHIMV
ncbi:MAG: IgA Peptidase M64, partial [Bacteroidaceae bacterium]|nr:IgA Peptidase M64 [Bacteroidaceae bacterium]